MSGLENIAADIGGRVEEILDGVGFEIWNNILNKQTNSGNAVNSLLLPADTTGKTAESLKVEKEVQPGSLRVTLVGRKDIMNIDKGNPPAESSGEWGSFDSFFQAIHAWARAKERRYGLEEHSIDEGNVAEILWEEGSVLWRAGGGTESIRDLLPPAAEQIDNVVNEAMGGPWIDEELKRITSFEQ